MFIIRIWEFGSIKYNTFKKRNNKTISTKSTL